MKCKEPLENINGIEAHFLLFALDDYYEVNERGKLTKAKHAAKLPMLQKLRDKLFNIHDHSPFDDELIDGEFCACFDGTCDYCKSFIPEPAEVETNENAPEEVEKEG